MTAQTAYDGSRSPKSMQNLCVAHLMVGIIAIMFLGGCGSYTQAQRQYVNRVSDDILWFKVPPEQSAAAWDRARTFVQQYSTMEIQILTDDQIGSRVPLLPFDFFHPQYGYQVRRRVDGTDGRFSVRAFSTNSLSNGPTLNAHILADYIQTGKLPFPKLISQ